LGHLWRHRFGKEMVIAMESNWYAYMDEFGIWRATNDSWTIPNNTRVRNNFKSEEEAKQWISREKKDVD